MRWGSLAAVGVMLTATPAAGVPRIPTPVPAPGWQVEASPFADLWYHGLAVVGYHGFGSHPLYDVGYGRRAARARPDGPLARDAGELRRALEADPAFELLHFVPVYLSGLTPDRALAGLRRVAESREPPAGSGDGFDIVAALLSTGDQRALLGRFVRALEQERARGLAGKLEAERDARAPFLARVEARWQDHFGPALAPYLEARGLGGGRMVITPALGLEGRFFEGDPTRIEDNLVIVGVDPTGQDPDATLAPAVRELCYPAVRQAFEAMQSRYADRIAASRASDAAATRCGELLLVRHLPEALPAYRSRFELGGSSASAWSSLPDPAEGREWDEALEHVLNLRGGS